MAGKIFTAVILVSGLFVSAAQAADIDFDNGRGAENAVIEGVPAAVPVPAAPQNGSLLREVIPGVWVQAGRPLPSNRNLRTVHREFRRILDAAFDQSNWQWEYHGATCDVLKITRETPLTEDELSLIAERDFGFDSLGEHPRPVELAPLANTADNMPAAQKYICTSGLVNDHCAGLSGVLQDALAGEPQIRLFAGAADDGYIRDGFVIFYDPQAGELFVIGSGYLHHM